MNQYKNFIKRSLLCLSLAGTTSGMLKAQNQPSTAARPNATPVTVPANYTNSNISFIRTWQPKMPSTDTAVIKSTSRTSAEVERSTNYFDGIGRDIQQVQKQASPTGKDLVKMLRYDSLGREEYSYLPYTPKTGNTNDGFFKLDAIAAQRSFYQDATLNPGARGENIYYTQTEYEPSPRNRVLRTYSPGDSWAKTGGNHPTETIERLNTLADSVRIWNINSGTIPTSTAVYAAGELQKTITTDPDGRQMVVYTDDEDQIILRKIQENSSPGSAHMGWMCTYYVYDVQNNLRFVVQPKAIPAIIDTWTISTSIANELCFMHRLKKPE